MVKRWDASICNLPRSQWVFRTTWLRNTIGQILKDNPRVTHTLVEGFG